jgi:hypothetical protein
MKNETFPGKKQLLEYGFNLVYNSKSSKTKLSQEDRTAFLEYAYSELGPLLTAISKTTCYKEKDPILSCADYVLGLIKLLCPGPDALPEDARERITALLQTVPKERYIETALDNMVEQDEIQQVDVANLLTLVNRTEDEFQKGKLYAGLGHYQDCFSKFSADAAALVSAHLSSEIRRYLSMEQHSDDIITNLEMMADLSKHFADPALMSLLYQLLNLEHSGIRYYAADTLLSAGRNISADVILSLAQSLAYANLTYALLVKCGKQWLFPKEYSVPEYLAKSDLVHWLMYPTELGKEPDEIEYIGKITYLFKKEVYYVFKYRSDSDTLDDTLKNKWLIGWSSNDGGTFSNFDEYALFEKGTIDATLKNIKKKLIG